MAWPASWQGRKNEDNRPPTRATSRERALCICGFRGRVFLNNAQLYLPGCNQVAEQFEPFGTFEDIGYHHRLDLDSPFGGLVSPAANWSVVAPINNSAKNWESWARRSPTAGPPFSLFCDELRAEVNH
jgi:hypothetical protein